MEPKLDDPSEEGRRTRDVKYEAAEYTYDLLGFCLASRSDLNFSANSDVIPYR